ncbi:MAG: S8 family peptidase [Cyclobacteriaceae bacterium]
MPNNYAHIFINNVPEVTPFTSIPASGSKPRIPNRNRISHGERLTNELQSIWQNVASQNSQREAISLPTKDGTYLEFRSQTGSDLITKSLEDIRQGVRLLNIRQVGNGENIQTMATVYIPDGKESHFIKKLQAYQDSSKDSKSGKPRNNDLVNSIQDIRLAFLEALWTDPLNFIPIHSPDWCEVWLRVSSSDESAVTSFLETLASLDIPYKPNYLSFPERAVILIYGKQDQFTELIARNDSLAEFRIGQEAAGFWVNESNRDQQGWVADLMSRINFGHSGVRICLLDSGVNNGHQLINPVLDDENCLTVNPEWGVDDHEFGSGHGTLMGGIAIYNKLEEALDSTEEISITHKLCSVKILPRPNQEETQKEFWGDITDQGISRAEINLPEERIVFCLSVTSKTDVDRGRPSSWSGAIDKSAFGVSENKRLIIVSSGNIKDIEEWNSYPDSNLTNSVQNPAQAWNALAVGAYTDKVLISDPAYINHVPLAPVGGLSPFSSTSFSWDRKKWPNKPDVVFEGGNILKAPDNQLIEGYEDYGLLSTAKNTIIRQFDLVNATSAAAAQASWLAAKIMEEYPQAWPETIRGLIIHSASWSDEMFSQFNKKPNAKNDIKDIMRLFGYGKPNKAKALYTTDKSLTFIAQEQIQPFIKAQVIKEGKKQTKYSTKDMHFFELPWPKEELLSNPDLEVELRITLSYFIEPGPGEVGWKDKYRYRSHGLCFDLNSETESEDEFKKRINAAAREEEEELANNSGSDRWMIGMNGRKSGSIHSDIWKGTAAEIASCNMIGVYPIIGWWKQRTHLQKCNSQTRYSLIVSLETPAVEIDLYTPVITKIQTPITIET